MLQLFPSFPAMEIVNGTDGLGLGKASCLQGTVLWRLLPWCTQALPLAFIALTLIFNACVS